VQNALNIVWPDPLGELTALPQTPYLDLRGLLLSEGRERRKGRDGRGPLYFVCGFTPMLIVVVDAVDVNGL